MCRKEYITHIYPGDRYVRQPYLTLCKHSDGRRACQNLREYDLGVRYHEEASEQQTIMEAPSRRHRRESSSHQRGVEGLRPARTFPVRSTQPPPVWNQPGPQRPEPTIHHHRPKEQPPVILQRTEPSSSRPSEKPSRRPSLRRSSMSYQPPSPTHSRKSTKESVESPQHRRAFTQIQHPPTPPSTEPRSTRGKRRASVVIGQERIHHSAPEDSPPSPPDTDSPESQKGKAQDMTEQSRPDYRAQRRAQKASNHTPHDSQDSAELNEIKRENAKLKDELNRERRDKDKRLSDLERDLRELKLKADAPALPPKKKGEQSPRFRLEIRTPSTPRQETYRDAEREHIIERQPQHGGEGRHTRPSTRSGGTRTVSSHSSVIENESQEEMEYVETRGTRGKDGGKGKEKEKKYRR